MSRTLLGLDRLPATAARAVPAWICPLRPEGDSPIFADAKIGTVPSLRGPAAGLPSPPRGILLDACNVLYDDTAWRRWLLRVLDRLGLRTTYGCFFHVLARDYLDDVYCGRRSLGEALGDYLRSVGLSVGQINEVTTALGSYRRSTEDHARPLTRVRQTLRQLRAMGLTLGVLSNTEIPGPGLRERLDRLFAPPLLTAVVSSRDLGRAMPDPACYAAALAALGLPAASVAFVGHDAAEL
ncbi:MAG: HAD family hydrolase, partial [Thermoguttaceae bacterium]